MHVRAMLDLKRLGSVAFDYGNNIRRMAADRGVKMLSYPGFVPEYIRPLFCEGRAVPLGGPFGEPADIAATDAAICRLFPQPGAHALDYAGEEACSLSGSPGAYLLARLWRTGADGSGNEPHGRPGELKAPIVIGRDHLDCGSVSSPYRETQAMGIEQRHRGLAHFQRPSEYRRGS